MGSRSKSRWNPYSDPHKGSLFVIGVVRSIRSRQPFHLLTFSFPFSHLIMIFLYLQRLQKIGIYNAASAATEFETVDPTPITSAVIDCGQRQTTSNIAHPL